VDGVDASWNAVTEKLNVVSNCLANDSRTFGKLDYKNAIEEDGSLRMFWTDYTEVNSSLCLFGKVQNKRNGSFVSCFVKVDNILRKLFFLPRTYRQRHGRDTTEEVEMKDVYEEVDELMSKMNVGMHKIKPCLRKYAFELPDVPKEADYLKLLYPYNSMSRRLGLKVFSLTVFQNLNYRLIRLGQHSRMFLVQTPPYSSSLCYGKM
jgi:DNA polymerase alpha subunit A